MKKKIEKRLTRVDTFSKMMIPLYLGGVSYGTGKRQNTSKGNDNKGFVRLVGAASR
jgi:hypothetical protein